MAGIGGAVCLAAMSLMGADTGWRGIPELFEPSELWKWGPGAAFGIALYGAVRRWGLLFILPVSVAVAVGAYHLVLAGLGVSGGEARATGLASVVAGLGGGTAASVIVPASLRSKLFGAASRLTGVAAALVIAAALFLGDGMLELVPVPLVGGILVFAGLGMLDQGLVRSRKRLPWSEYAVIVLIVVVILAFGLFEGVGAGMLATLAFFGVRLSRVDPIESRFTVRERRSTRVRSVPDRVILQEDGERAVTYRLRGYIFFGSVCPLADHLRNSLVDDPPPACLVLDFANVSGVDVSAVNVLARFAQSANAAGMQVVLSAPSEQLTAGLGRALAPSEFEAVAIEPNVDRALERGEDIVLAGWQARASADDEQRGSLLERAAGDLERHLERQIRFEHLVDELRGWLTPRRYAAGEVLAGPGAPNEGLQQLTEGRASAHGAAGRRVGEYGPGDAIWPLDPSDPKAPTVRAEGSSSTVVLTPAARRWLEEHEERLALKLYRYLLARGFEAEPTTPRPDGAAKPRSRSPTESPS